MKVLFPVDEAYPLYKIGGLGDVGGSLPKALHKLGLDVRIALPCHPEINTEAFSEIQTFSCQYADTTANFSVLKGKLPNTNVPVYLFKEDTYISQKTDASDNHANKFAIFSLGVCHWLLNSLEGWQPDVIHFNDWHTSLIPIILKHKYQTHKYKTLGTIHNLMYQGETSDLVLDSLEIPQDKRDFLAKKYPENIHLNILLEGLMQADAFNAVSPRYAKEILTDEYGEGVNQYLQKRKDSIFGVLNGIDTDVFNPQKDEHIFTNFSKDTALEGKASNKQELLKKIGLSQDLGNKLLMGFVGRVDPDQKGVQLIIDALNSNRFDFSKYAFVFLGTGAEHLEQQLHEASKAHRQDVKIFTRYDEPLAAQIYAASDFMIIPSKFEPCGLVQMIAMRYGAIPVARKTGGLADTIIDGENGFLFEDYTTQSFTDAVGRAVTSLLNDLEKARMVNNALNVDFSWDTPAQEYVKIYQRI